MKSDLTNQKLHLQALNTHIIPWLSSEEGARILFAEPPIELPPKVYLIGERPALPVSKRTDRTKLFYHRWEKEEMKAIRYVLLGCVLEGEADYVVGGIPETSSSISADGKGQCNSLVLTLPQKTFFIIPPGVPHSDGMRYHWERPAPEKAFSRIFWLLITPVGFLCHLCTTQGTQHRSTTPTAIRDYALYKLTRLLIDEMRERDAQYKAIGKNLLLAAIYRVCRGLERGEIIPHVPGWQGVHPTYLLPSTEDATGSKVNMIVNIACAYIEEHIADPLSLNRIAFEACVSPTHLNRQFRVTLGTSVMQYVTQRRIEIAKQLLTSLDANVLPIRELSTLVGFPDPAYFSRVFKKCEHDSPEAYRRKHLKSS